MRLKIKSPFNGIVTHFCSYQKLLESLLKLPLVVGRYTSFETQCRYNIVMSCQVLLCMHSCMLVYFLV